MDQRSIVESLKSHGWKLKNLRRGDPVTITENYRPISVLPALSKVLEIAVHHQLTDYLETNKLLNKFQFGYRSKRSTELATALLLDDIRNEVDKGKLVGAIFLDLSKAFDTLSHSILLAKLPSYGIENDELSWIKDYLFRRTQVVEHENKRSDSFMLMTGVPQGSILGPLLFLLYFNDFVDCLDKAKVVMYADDTVVYFSSADFIVIENTLQTEIKHISTYLKENDLVANLKKGKTESMLFSTDKRLSKTPRKLSLEYKYQVIHSTKRYKYLGCILDPCLNLNDFLIKVTKS